MNSEEIKAKALRLGFVACGMAPALPLPNCVRNRFQQWIAQGKHASMGYLARNEALRFAPALLVPGAKTVISVALPYRPLKIVEGIARYAHGEDYHHVMRQLLHQLMTEIDATGRAFVDTAPVAEKYWAWRCGLGWQGKHTQLIIPHLGTMHFLGELIIHQKVSAHNKPMANRCGSCQRCIEACPASALSDGGLDARRCLSYLTIEHRGDWPNNLALDNCFYGCDHCLLTCPHTRLSPIGHPAFQPSKALLNMKRADWLNLSPKQYQLLFAKSAIRRASYEDLLRNIRALRD